MYPIPGWPYMYDLLDRLTLDFDGFFVLHNIQHCLDQSLSNNCKSSRTAFDVELFNSHRIIYPFWNQYLWFLSIQSLCQTTADLHKKNPACADASVSKGGVYHRSLALSAYLKLWPLLNLPALCKGAMADFFFDADGLEGRYQVIQDNYK